MIKLKDILKEIEEDAPGAKCWPADKKAGKAAVWTQGSKGKCVGYEEDLDEEVEEEVDETIKKVDDKYVVYPKKGGKRLGTHTSKKKALKQLAAIEINK
jgi:hypothetical protein